VQVNTGKVNRAYGVSYVNPYFTVDGVSQGFDIYKKKVDASSLSVGAYTTDTTGGGVKFGYPLSETESINFGIVGEHVKLGLFDSSPAAYKTFVTQFGTSYTYGSGLLGWSSDRRDSAIMPTRGALIGASIEMAGGDLQYYRINVTDSWYYPLSRTVTLALNGDLGYVHGLSGKPVPFFKNFYAGGPSSVRGYKAFSLGQQDSGSNVLGGTRKFSGSAEILFPFPGAQQDKSLRLSAFLDVGQVYAFGQKLDLGELRYSAGIGFSWSSPFGPLKLSFGQPLNAKKGFDRVERLQFQFGSAF
jgi:outer membrane protein insertion porin family